jgi:chromosome segregation ATPase
MSKDLTQNLNGSLEDKVDRLITIVQSMDSRLENVETNLETRLESLETRLESLETRLESLETRLASLETRLASLETKVDERLKDTRPMWEVVQTQLASLRESQDRLRGEMEKGFRLVDRRLESQPVEFDKLYRYHRDLEERVEKIEKQLT